MLEATQEEIEFIEKPEKPISSEEEITQLVKAHDESMGYVDAAWLRGGRYDIDPGFHDKPDT